MESTNIWTELARNFNGGLQSTLFLSETGQIVSLPTEFVEAFVANAVLDAQFVPLPDDPAMIQLVRAGQVDAIFPLSLLRTLILFRRRKSDEKP